MSNNKQSSIDWLVEILGKYNEEMVFLYQNEIEQAKAMHKEEIINAHTIGYVIGGGNGYIHEPEQYYNETFGNESNN